MQEGGLKTLSRRERQIMDTIFMLGEATAADVLENLPEAASEASIRKIIRILEHKGHLTHRSQGSINRYRPTIPASEAAQSAMQNMLRTFFEGSVPKAVTCLLDITRGHLSEDDIGEINALIKGAELEGK